MANRHTLHKNDLGNLRQYLVERGWTILPTKGPYEVLRARRYDYPRPLLVHEKADCNSGDHFSIDERDGDIYRAYFNWKDRKHRAKEKSPAGADTPASGFDG